ncbi:MAG: hypothetical protein LAQ69_01085 [Acidobacteriia bacterium]|nr:hypothetical protein [Terriglobia bacterium]
MREFEKLESSALMQRLIHSTDREVLALATTVQSVATKAAALLATVVVDMPLYTLHNERHILNVIGWMESLLEDKGIERLSPFECGLCLLAAYSHDLGMTLSRQECDALPTDPDYLRFRDRYLEERHLIDGLREAGEHHRANLIENHLRTEYLRVTHADGMAKRLCARLGEIAPDLVYRGVDYRRQLELVAISHNHPVEWLRLQFEKEDLAWHETVGKNEAINFPFVGILLRLADVMDFDSSRTPSILFRHIGLDRELANRFEEISGQEWKKHLAITGIDWLAGDGLLTYRAANCPHPAVEKSIRDFVGMIQREVSQAASELRHLHDEGRCLVRLPEVKAEVKAAREDGAPRYTYHDWNFRLDQDEIIRLLMGESLYGDPSLCIRELLQNALDAVELRDLRLQLRRKGGQPAEPVDGESLAPGRFLCGGIEEAFAVKLTWGEEGGHQFIRVEDNGTGMTEGVIERYFTQIGKSFYQSPDFRGEQAEMRRHGLIATPISTFGIGVLSCFMIADRVGVRTHPGQVSGSRPALDLEISGPGSLFWTRPGTRTRQGTEVTLWLRKELHGKPVRLEHDRERCFQRLRNFLSYSNAYLEESDGLDPGLIAAQHVVWPKYPVHIAPSENEHWTIDGRFHVDHLAPIDRNRFVEKIAEWEYPLLFADDPRWELIEWTDDHCEEATGTRVRIWFPENPGAEDSLQFWELAAFVGAQVQAALPLVTVQSMRVRDTKAIHSALPFAPGAGCRAWIDLRGTATPRLTADRGTALIPPDESEWRGLVARVWERCARDLVVPARGCAPRLLWSSWRAELAEVLRPSLPDGPRSGRLVRDSSKGHTWRLATVALLMDLALDLTRATNLAHTLTRAFTLAHILSLGRDLPVALNLGRALDCSLSRDFARPLALAITRDRDPDRDLTHPFDPAHARILARGDALHHDLDRNRAPKTPPTTAHLNVLHTSWLQEAFFPSLSQSWPGLELQGLEGKIGDAVLTSPASFRFELNGRLVLFADQQGTEPPQLSRYQYDLCFPMTAIPIGRLRREFPAWREDRRYRPLGVLPFLMPELAKVWQKHAKRLLTLFPIGEIYAFQPAEKLWYKPFAEWTPADWQDSAHRSLLWNIGKGIVLTAPGVHPRDTFPTVGKPFQEFG